MPLRRVARRDAIDIHRHNLGPCLIHHQADDRVQRPDPTQAAAAPTHGFWPGEVADGLFQHLSQNVPRLAPRLFDHSEEHRALLVLTLFHLISGQTRRSQEPFDRLLRGVHIRPLALFAHGGTLCGQPLDRERQAARRRKRGGPCVGQASFNQAVGDEPFKVIRRFDLHPRGDFFGEEFD